METSPSILRSSIGRKYIVAITGLMLVGFLVAHLSGNLLIFAGAEAMSAYAEGLRTFPALLWALRLGLLVAFLAHVYFAVTLNLENRSARDHSYKVKKFRKASFASRSMLYSGMMMTLYIGYHLAHLTWRLTDPALESLGPYDVYPMLILSFQQPLIAGIYILANLAMGLHLSHGISSVFQTLGLSNKLYRPLIEKAGPLIGWGLAFGFISIPLAVLFGIVQ